MRFFGSHNVFFMKQSLVNNDHRPGAFLVVGTDTGVGKTVFTGLLGRYLEQKDLGFILFKPFCSGGREDIKYLQTANIHNDIDINYWYYEAPISPAAWELQSNQKIDFVGIIEALRRQFENHDREIILVEGVGGLLSPISISHSVASIGEALNAKLIIVAPNRVGVVNQVLLTLEAALNRGLSIASVVLIGQEFPDISAANNAELIKCQIPEMPDFKGIFDLPWLGESASNPNLINANFKRAECFLKKIFDMVINPHLL
jgi:dethiobiotin synthetase